MNLDQSLNLRVFFHKLGFTLLYWLSPICPSISTLHPSLQTQGLYWSLASGCVQEMGRWEESEILVFISLHPTLLGWWGLIVTLSPKNQIYFSGSLLPTASSTSSRNHCLLFSPQAWHGNSSPLSLTSRYCNIPCFFPKLFLLNLLLNAL